VLRVRERLPQLAGMLTIFAGITTFMIMKRIVVLFCLLLVIGLAQAAAAAGALQHVVCFKFKATASAEEIRKVETAFAALKTKIPEIVSLAWGTNVSPEQFNKGFTHCFVLTFKTAKDRDAYLVHPDHKAFGKLVGPAVDDVFVIDFQAKE
jgi:hypothetical protein